MELGKSGWLRALVEEAISSHASAATGQPAAHGNPDARLSPRARARAGLQQMVRDTGLLYGTPTESGAADAGGRPAEEVLFLAVLRTFVRISVRLAEVTQAPAGPRAQQVLHLLAALVGEREAAEVLGAGGTLRGRRLEALEEAVEQRAMSLAGDPAYGLALHNGAVYTDVQVLGRNALQLFLTGALPWEAAARRAQFAARQKAVLVEVLSALACVERPPNFSTRRAILRQVEDLHLPDGLTSSLRAKVKRTFDRVPPLEEVVRDVRSRGARRFVLEQALLASLVDGRRSRAELRYLHALASALRFDAAEVARIEVEMAEFYARNRAVVDVFTVSEGAGLLGDELIGSMQSAVEKNFYRLLQEIRETGELSVLLTKAARGQSLTEAERAAMRGQLIDVAKAIPALAIFAAPGGVLLLIALAKVLPFDLRPSSFQEPPPREDGGPEPRGGESDPD
ncbi:MAG: hypothetical protein RL653_3913 [Pseudomonadota bacterium]|jgi:hypothetical protein